MALLPLQEQTFLRGRGQDLVTGKRWSHLVGSIDVLETEAVARLGGRLGLQ